MKIIERIVNTDTQEIVDVERELTAGELAERNVLEAERVALLNANQEAELRKANAKAKLEALGLNEADLKALGL